MQDPIPTLTRCLFCQTGSAGLLAVLSVHSRADSAEERKAHEWPQFLGGPGHAGYSVPAENPSEGES